MSAAMAEGKGTMKDVMDKLILVLVLVLLLLSSIYLLVMIQVERGRLKDGGEGLQPSRPFAAQPLDQAAFDESLSALVNAGELRDDSTNRIPFSPGMRVACVNPQCAKPIPYSAEICPFCKAEQPPAETISDDRDEDGIPDSYEKEHGMDPYDHRDALADQDGDGFSNREEYESKTDPTDPEDRPPFAAKLRVTKARQRLFDLTFWGIQRFSADQLNFQLNSRKLGKSYFPIIGEEVEGYIVDRYLPDAPEGPTLMLTKGGKEYSLLKDEPFTGGDWTANLISLMSGRQFRELKMDSELDVRDAAYIVVDIGTDAVIIQDKATEKDLSVGLITRAEAQQLKSRLRSGGTPR